MTFAPQMPQDAPAYDRPGWVPPPPYPQYAPNDAPRPPVRPSPAMDAPYRHYTPYAPPMARRTCPDAVVSLIAAIAGWVFFPFVGAVVAVAFGVRARRQIREAGGLLDGEGMATVGVVLGGLQLAGFALLILGGLLALAVGVGMFVGSR